MQYTDKHEFINFHSFLKTYGVIDFKKESL